MPNQMEMFKDAVTSILYKIEKYFTKEIKLQISESKFVNCLELNIGIGNIQKTFIYRIYDYQDIMCFAKRTLLLDILDDVGSVINLVEGIY